MGTHTGDKPYQCTPCIMSFLNKSDLLKHKMTHTEKKPFQCCSFDKCFSYNSNLFIRMRTHRGEKPFKCRFYDKAISNKNNISKFHMAVHSGEKTSQCISNDGKL